MNVLLDMDGVITDFVPAVIEQYNYLTNEKVQEDQIKGKKIDAYVQDPMTAKRIKNATGFLRGLKPSYRAIDAITYLHDQGHNIIFVSVPTRCSTSGDEKKEWLNYYFSKLWQKAPLIMTPPKYKRFVRGDILVDDDPDNLENLPADMKGLLWHQKYNSTVMGFERCYGWDHLINLIEKNEI